MTDSAPAWRLALRWLRDPRVRADVRWERQRRWLGEPRLPNGSFARVLVICHGNVCRSPFAGELLAQRLPEIEVDSAGLSATEGDPADPLALRCAARRGVDLGTHRTRRVTGSELRSADLVLGMQGRHLRAAVQLEPEAATRLRLLGDFLDRPPFAIEDPWGRGEERFEQVFDRIERAVDRLTELVRQR